MIILDARQRARRRRVEGRLLATLMLALTVTGAALYVVKLAHVLTGAGALFRH